MKKNRLLKRNASKMRERIIKRNEMIRIIKEEKRELNYQSQLYLSEAE